MRKKALRQILKEYMTNIYKWGGKFDLSNGLENIMYDPLICELQAEIFKELQAKKLSENIIQTTINMEIWTETD